MAETDEAIADFIARWQGVTGLERANYQLFLSELAAALDLPPPEPAEADDGANAYALSAGWCSATTTATRRRLTGLKLRGAFVQDSKEIKTVVPLRRCTRRRCRRRPGAPCNDQFGRFGLFGRRPQPPRLGLRAPRLLAANKATKGSQ